MYKYLYQTRTGRVNEKVQFQMFLRDNRTKLCCILNQCLIPQLAYCHVYTWRYHKLLRNVRERLHRCNAIVSYERLKLTRIQGSSLCFTKEYDKNCEYFDSCISGGVLAYVVYIGVYRPKEYGFERFSFEKGLHFDHIV